MASSSHRRRSRPERPDRRGVRVPVIAVGAVAAVALLVSLVVAFRPDGGTTSAADAGRGTTPSTASETSTSPTATPSLSSSPSPSTSPSPSPSSSSSSSSPSGSTASPAPSASKAASSSVGRPAATAPRKPASSTGSLAGRIAPGTDRQGVATSYDVGDGDGACSYGPTSDVMTAAMNTADYETSKACGAYVSVRAGSGKSITVRITNECPAPCEAGQLDLSRQAFAKLAPLSAGRIPITWSLLSPATSEKISIRYKTGSTRYWCGIQAIGHRNPLARLEVRVNGSWTALARTAYNYFLSESGAGCGGAIRLTDVYGEQLTVDALPVRADVVQATGLQFAQR